MRLKSECICGKSANLIVGTRILKALDKEITVHNLPHFKCNDCNSVWYDSKTAIDEALVKAYKKGLNEIDFDDFSNNQNI